MIHKYYCVNCGKRFNGEDIRFDLTELIGLRNAEDENSTANPAALVRPGVLMGNAELCKQVLTHGKLTPLTMTLGTFFKILAVNCDDRTKQVLINCKYDENDLRIAFESLIKSNENPEVLQQKVNEYVSRVKTLFVLDNGKTIGSDEPEDYKCTFWIEPEFFEDGHSKEIYTLKYAKDENDANPIHISAHGQPIRGYCPNCGKPILLNTGKYPHVLIGLLGASSAGKTTMILSIMQEIEINYDQYGIEYPGTFLCDSRFNILQQNQNLFNNGWLPVKTQETGVNSFNASYVFKSANEDKNLLVTFADIAGEQCYDPKTKQIKMAAIRVFPLINNCDVYILCSCIDRTQYVKKDELEQNDGAGEKITGNNRPSNGINKEKTNEISPQAVLAIAKGIYENLKISRKNDHKTPPLCIVMTKADVVNGEEEQNVNNNPFNRIEVSPNYLYKAQLTNLSTIYKTTETYDVKEPLEWCCKAYDEMKRKTYVSMMACSATGRVGDTWTNKSIDPPMNLNGSFSSIGINSLVDWIFKVIGLSSVTRGYKFDCIPSYDEAYVGTNGAQINRDEHFTIQSAGFRCTCIPYVFLNKTMADDYVLAALRGEIKDKKGKSVPFVEAMEGAGLLMKSK